MRVVRAGGTNGEEGDGVAMAEERLERLEASLIGLRTEIETQVGAALAELVEGQDEHDALLTAIRDAVSERVRLLEERVTALEDSILTLGRRLEMIESRAEMSAKPVGAP